MALTIRTLTPSAEENLNLLIEKNPAFFKTKSKAINFVLEQYYPQRDEIKELYKIKAELENEIIELKKKEKQIKNSIKNIIEFIK